MLRNFVSKYSVNYRARNRTEKSQGFRETVVLLASYNISYLLCHPRDKD